VQTRSAVVTILICDEVGSTARMTRIGDIAADDLRREMFVVLRAVVGAHGGRVVKTLGDGLMAVFPESAVDAVVAAAEMHEAAQAMSTPIELRVGLATGEASEHDGDWYGRPVVEAARLCAKAEPGETLLTALTRDVIGSRGSIPLTSAGMVVLKGLPGPVPVFRIGAADHAAGTPKPTRRRPLWIAVAVVLAVGTTAVVIATTRSTRSEGEQLESDQTGTAPATTTSPPISLAGAVSAAATDGYTPRLEPRDCSAHESEGDPTVTCFTLVVPMDRTDLAAGNVRLPVVRAPALDGAGTGVPNVLVALGGGALATSSLRVVSEQVRLAVRGEDDATPSLACPELDTGRVSRLAEPMQQAVTEVNELLDDCRVRLTSDGVALDRFGPSDVADDIRDLATAIGVSKIDLRVVYETNSVALEMLKRGPGIVRAVTFGGPNAVSSVSLLSARAEAAWDAYIRQCAAQAACAPRAGELDAALDRLLDELTAAPRPVDVTIPGETGTKPLLMDGDRFAFGVWVALSDPLARQYLADVVLTGNLDTAAAYLTAVPFNGEPIGLRAMLWRCAEGVAAAELVAEASVAGRWRILVDTMLSDHCNAIDVPLVRWFAVAVTSNAAALVLVGELDPLAPPDEVARFFSGMPNAQLGELPGSVFGGLGIWPACINDIREDFLTDPTAVFDLNACTSQHSPPPIVITET
jgi:class 3 adenylate cyclase/pimeloyl-ACP methyl ester carboxylesterase